jgi:hypothetical protein
MRREQMRREQMRREQMRREQMRREQMRREIDNRSSSPRCAKGLSEEEAVMATFELNARDAARVGGK